MASRAVMERPKPAVPVQQDPDILNAAARLAGEDLCSMADLSSAEVRAILKLGHHVKQNPREFRHALDAKQMVLMFEKASLRTRLSFETGINTLGGNAVFFDQTNSPLGERESIADVAKNVERWVDVIVLRTYAHDTITEMAANSRVPVINALSDFEHPCQALADIQTFQENFSDSRGRTIVYLGDGNNVAASLAEAGAMAGINVCLSVPQGCDLPADQMSAIVALAKQNGVRIWVERDPVAAVTGASALYTDVWISMGQQQDGAKIEALKPYQVNEALLAKAASDAIVLHCLPAHRGDEITDGVMDGPQSRVFDQAENRLHAQKALMAYLIGGRAL